MVTRLLLAGAVLLTAAATLSTLVVWYRSYRSYRSHLRRGGRVALLSMAPLVALTASPLLDLTLWLVTGRFPTVGFLGPGVGVAGTVLATAVLVRDLSRVPDAAHPAVFRALGSS
jgi:hypothetical protein